MVQVILVGIGAGLAAALLFLSPIGGTLLAFPLFALCGLPVAIAGFAWGGLAAIFAAATAAAVVLVFFSWPAAAVHLLLFGAPIAWLTRLANLSRPADPAKAGSAEWFPLGRLLAHAAVAVSIGVVIVGIIIGFDPDALAADMTDAFLEWMAQSPGAAAPPTAAEVAPFVRFNVDALPFTVSALLLIVVVFNMWLGAKVAAMSGRLRRRQEPLWTAVLPSEAVAAFLIGGAGALLAAGAFGQAAGAVTGAFGAAIALIGLAVVHALTIGGSLRTLILVTTYFLLVLFGFPILLLLFLGLAESALDIRARRTRGAPPFT